MLTIKPDPIQSLSVKLQAALQLYLEGNGGRIIGQITNLNIPPRIKFKRCIHGIIKFIDVNQWNPFFAEGWHRQNMEECLGELYSGFQKIAMESQDQVTQAHIHVDDLMKITNRRIRGIGSDKTILVEISNLLLKNSQLFKIALINGSIGSGDFKPGWSDIDIFIALKRSTLQSPVLLKKARNFARMLHQKIYNYCILQLHGVFYSAEYNFGYHVDQLFPVECLINGQSHSDSSKVTLNIPSSNDYALTYFNNHIYRSSKNLLSSLPDLTFFQKILLIHRLYAFPFAFLATQNILKYKKDSYTAIADLFSDLFHEIGSYYESVNSFYLTWHVNKLRTIKLRRLFHSQLNMRYINAILYPLEKEIVHQIDYFYDHFMTKNTWNRFEQYLHTSHQYLLRQAA